MYNYRLSRQEGTTNLSADWPYCNYPSKFVFDVMTSADPTQWSTSVFRPSFESINGDNTVITSPPIGPKGETRGICEFGELTDKGRSTTLALGQRLRHLYVDQLEFMPATIRSADDIYLRASHMTRAVTSLQQAYLGMYPASTHAPGMAPPAINRRSHNDENLYPNTGACQRLKQLSVAFRARAGERWDESSELAYVQQKIGKWMPAESPKLSVTGHPAVSGILDHINSTRAHGPETRLPDEFYDEQLIENIQKIAMEEWFQGYRESREYRTLGAGFLLSDITARMVEHVENKGTGFPRFAMHGCHDTTLGSMLASLGAFDGEPWPPYTSHLAFELFKAVEPADQHSDVKSSVASMVSSSGLGGAVNSVSERAAAAVGIAPPKSFGRVRSEELKKAEKESMKGYYVRVRYNTRAVTFPACKAPGKHLEGRPSFCTLEEFKRLADTIAPRNWREECKARPEVPLIPAAPELAEGS